MNKKPTLNLKGFVPSWPSSVMGTGIIPIALYLGRSAVPLFLPLSQIFAVISVIMLLIINILWISRYLKYPDLFQKELHHPVTGSFIPTLPIAFMIIAIDFMIIGPDIMGKEWALKLATGAFWLGTAGIYLFSWMIMPALFHSKEVKGAHGTFGWFIPPVSHLIVPVVGLEIIHHSVGIFSPEIYFWISMISLGTGLFLFLLIGPNIFHRYIYQSSPMGKMAPTLFIGAAPTAILTIILIKLNAALPFLDKIELVSIKGFAQLTGALLVGFSLWWLVLSIIKIIHALTTHKLSFTLSWWAFTFPVGAVSVALGALNTLFQLPTLRWLQVGLSSFLLILWTVITVLTIKGIANRSIFED